MMVNIQSHLEVNIAATSKLLFDQTTGHNSLAELTHELTIRRRGLGNGQPALPQAGQDQSLELWNNL